MEGDIGAKIHKSKIQDLSARKGALYRGTQEEGCTAGHGGFVLINRLMIINQPI